MTSSPTIAIVGGSLSGNKGAASMVQAVIDGTRARWQGVSITVLTPLPEEDHHVATRTPDVRLVPFRPRDIVTAAFVAPLHRLLRPGTTSRHEAVAALAKSDVVVDVSGISFVDGRGIVTLAYNILLVLVPLLLSKPVVKIAQAMGPFRSGVNRWAAGRILPRMSAMAARGQATAEHLRDLGVTNWRSAPDVAFLMHISELDRAWAARTAGPGPVAVVTPSMVVHEREEGDTYVRLMAAAVDRLASSRDVLLVPHAARPGRPAGRLNDIPLCHEILNRVRDSDRCRVAGSDASPGELRALIGRSELLVTSRFHAMISGLATGTPVLVVGWSHKYREVLEDFGLAEWSLDFRGASSDTAVAAIDRLSDAAPRIRSQILDRLPRVTEEAGINLSLIERAVDET